MHWGYFEWITVRATKQRVDELNKLNALTSNYFYLLRKQVVTNKTASLNAKLYLENFKDGNLAVAVSNYFDKHFLNRKIGDIRDWKLELQHVQ